MDIAEYIKTHPRLNLKSPTGRGEARGHCPFHPGGNYDCFAINVDTGYWLCRAGSCGLRGSFPLFYKLMEGIESWQEVQKRLGLHRPLKSYAELLNFLEAKVRVSEIRTQELPDPVFQTPITRENFPSYLQVDRQYTPALLDYDFDLRLGLGGLVRNRLVIPFYSIDNELLTWVARSMDPSNPLRYVFPEGATTEHFLFGANRLNKTKSIRRIWLVEGQFDVFRLTTFGEVALGISKGITSNLQLIALQKIALLYGSPPVWVCFDNTATTSAKRTWLDVRSFGIKTKLIDLGSATKDPDGLRLDSFRELVGRYED